jgi:NitT/TauT family transport system substrate-binding protein
MHIMQSRRDFLASASLAAAAGVFGARKSLADEGPLETTTIRLSRYATSCLAPEYIGEDLLRAEGFTDIRYVEAPPATVGNGELDFDMETAAFIAAQLDAGAPVTALAGVHVGCFELFAHEPIRTIRDLQGRTVSVYELGSPAHLQVAIMAAHVGLDPPPGHRLDRAAGWQSDGAVRRGKVDAFLGFPPEPQELRARKIGRTILRTATDKPWSQYFCCLLYTNREFVRAHPIATKRVLRVILKAADICAADPARAAQLMVDAGWASRYDYALQSLTELPYDVWREYDPEDSMRFYALRLREVDMIKLTPQEVIAEGTDWRFLNELKRELKT